MASEFSVFIAACLLGNLICMVYCALRIFRRIIRHSLFWIAMEDVLFWIGTAVYLFVHMYRTCSGSIRWYFVVGVLLGGLLTGEPLQKMFIKIVDKTEETR